MRKMLRSYSWSYGYRYLTMMKFRIIAILIAIMQYSCTLDAQETNELETIVKISSDDYFHRFYRYDKMPKNHHLSGIYVWKRGNDHSNHPLDLENRSGKKKGKYFTHVSLQIKSDTIRVVFCDTFHRRHLFRRLEDVPSDDVFYTWIFDNDRRQWHSDLIPAWWWTLSSEMNPFYLHEDKKEVYIDKPNEQKGLRR